MARQIKRKVGLMCSGGDGSGMNASVYYLTKYLLENNFEVVHFFGGFDGLCDDKTIKIELKNFIHHINDGGAFIRSGRSDQFRTKKGMKKALKVYKQYGLECIVAIGGNGTYNGIIDAKNLGMNFIGIPATIDNDIFYTSYSLGFDSATNANIQIIKAITNSCYATNKIPIVEIMGRDCGKLALASAIGSGADILVVKEIPKTIEEILTEFDVLESRGKHDILIVASEKNIDLQLLAKRLGEKTKRDVRVFVNGYAQRGAETSAWDRNLAARFSLEAFKLAKNKDYNKVVGSKQGQTFAIDIEEALKTTNNFNAELYDSLYFNKKNV